MFKNLLAVVVLLGSLAVAQPSKAAEPYDHLNVAAEFCFGAHLSVYYTFPNDQNAINNAWEAFFLGDMTQDLYTGSVDPCALRSRYQKLYNKSNFPVTRFWTGHMLDVIDMYYGCP